MSNEKELFTACRLLFGEDIEPSHGFLGYLRMEGIAGAFKKKALQYHPDRALLSGLSKPQAQDHFIRLQGACHILREHVKSQQANGKTNSYDENKPQSGHTSYENELPQKQLLFGRFLYHSGIVDFRQIVQALAWQKSGRLKLGELAVKLGYLNRKSVNLILNCSRDDGNSRFGKTAWRLGLLSQNQIQKLLQDQRRQQKKIGEFFVKQGVLNALELEMLLSRWKEHNRQVQSIVDGGKRMESDERRKHTRVHFCTTVDVTFSDTSYIDYATENLSTQGVFVDNIPNRTLGEPCHITLKLTGSAEELALSMQAEVIRLENNGIGLHFTDIDIDSFSHLRRIIYYNSDGGSGTKNTL